MVSLDIPNQIPLFYNFIMTNLFIIDRRSLAVGHEPEMLIEQGWNAVNIIVNSSFPASGRVIAYEFYRTFPSRSGCIGIWRPLSPDNILLDPNATASFKLLYKTCIDPGPSGRQILRLKDPLPVQKGDLLGVLKYHVIANAYADDWTVLGLKPTVFLVKKVGNGNPSLGATKSSTDYDYRTYALRAIFEAGMYRILI